MKFLFAEALLCCPVVEKRPYAFSTVASSPQYEDTQEASGTKNKNHASQERKRADRQTDHHQRALALA
jgi:hypothetical protein